MADDSLRDRVLKLHREGLSVAEIGVVLRETPGIEEHARRWVALTGMETKCRGCSRSIYVEYVRPGEDATIPWRVKLPRAHALVSDLPDRVHYRCSETGDRHIFFPSTNKVKMPDSRELDWWIAQHRSKLADLVAGPDCGRTSPTPSELRYFEDKIRELGGTPDTIDPDTVDADHVDHETWLEYHDRLIREYFDGERDLLKEIYPEAKKEAPTPRQVRRTRRPRLHPYHGIAATWLALSVLNFTTGNSILAIIWFTTAMVMFLVASAAHRR